MLEQIGHTENHYLHTGEYNDETSETRDGIFLNACLPRERKEVPNNVIAYNYFGEERWKINDIVQAKMPRGYDEIEKNVITF